VSEAAARGPRSTSTVLALVLLAVLVSAGFLALGAWQLQRQVWKEALIARIEHGQQAVPVGAPPPAAWPSIRRTSDEYRRVQVRGQFDHAHETLVQASTVLGSGYWVLTPLRTEQGWWLWVNRGFVPPEQRHRATRSAAEPQGLQKVQGLLRWSEPGGSLLQHNDAAAGRWYSRDVPALAAAQGLVGAVAPYFIDATADIPPQDTWPRPGLTVLHFSNNHRVYACTWFALAALTVGAIGLLLRHERRLRRYRGDPVLAPDPL
jgi:surfeit locus 1 family protein